MNHCKDCKYWSKPEYGEGECSRLDHDGHLARIGVDNPDTWAILWTKADFGCVQFEPNLMRDIDAIREGCVAMDETRDL